MNTNIKINISINKEYQYLTENELQTLIGMWADNRIINVRGLTLNGHESVDVSLAYHDFYVSELDLKGALEKSLNTFIGDWSQPTKVVPWYEETPMDVSDYSIDYI